MDDKLLRDLISRLDNIERTAIHYRKTDAGAGKLVAQGIELPHRITWESLGGGVPAHDGLRGDYVVDTDVVAGGTLGAVCVTTGPPSTWKRAGIVSA